MVQQLFERAQSYGISSVFKNKRDGVPVMVGRDKSKALIKYDLDKLIGERDLGKIQNYMMFIIWI